MLRPSSLFTALVVWLLAAASLLAESDPLAVIPDDALGLGVINHLADANAKVLKLTQKMQLPAPGLLPTIQLLTGVKQGLDYKGSLAAALFAVEDEDSESSFSLAVFVPTTDYKSLVGQLQPDDAEAEIAEVNLAGGEYLVAKKGDFAVFVGSDEKDVLKKIVASTKSVAESLAPLRAWMAEQQGAIVVTPAGKKLLFEKADEFLGTGISTFGSLDEEMKDEDDQEKDDADKDADKDDDKQDEAKDKDGEDDDSDDGTARVSAQLQSISDMMQAVKSILPAAQSQLTHLGLGVRIDDQAALFVTARILFTEQGKLSQWAKAVKPPDKGLLFGLPSGKYVLAYGAVWAETGPEVARLVNLLTQSGLSQLGLSKEQTKKFFAILDRQRANQLSTCGMFGSLRPGDSLASASLTVEYVKSASEHLKLTRDTIELLKQIKLPGGKSDEPLYSLQEVTVGDLKALEVTTNMSALTGSVDDEEAAEKMQGFFGKLFGSGGVMRAYMVASDDHTVVTAYSKEMLTRGVAHVRSAAKGLEADEQIAKTTALLPQGSQWAAYINPQGLVQVIDVLVRELLPADFKIPPFPPSDPIGLAAHVDDKGLDAALVLPENVVAGIGQYIGVIQNMMMQGGGAELP